MLGKGFGIRCLSLSVATLKYLALTGLKVS